jgi:hypothetical protein
MGGAARFRATAVVLLASALAALTLSAGASAVNSNKPYSIVICGGGQTGCTSANPAVIAPGGTAGNPSSLSVTFTNDNKPGSGIQLGSDNLNVPSTPAGFSVIATPLPTIVTPLPTSPPQTLQQCPASFNNSAPPCFILINGGTTVGFRNLNLAPGLFAMITMSAVTPPPPPTTTGCTTTSPCAWSDEAKQSNDFSGTGNDLNSDSNSAYGTVTNSVASCTKNNRCMTTLADGGTAASAAGSISTTVSTSSGKTAVMQVESIDFGPPLADDHTTPNPPCSGVTSPHLTSENLSNGPDRSQTITINTTHFNGYVAQACFETTTQFTQLMIAPDGTESLAPANPTTLPDGSPGFIGLLPDCATSPPQPLQVDCGKNPGVVSRQTTFAADGTTPLTHTLVAAVPPGFDSRIGN